MKYSPTYTCLFQGAQWFLENGGRDAIGGNGKSVIMDAALLIGDDPYRYPDNLPIVNANGGPGGKPSCGSLPDVRQELPGEVPGHRHRIRHRPRCPAESGHRLPRHRQLLPGHQRPTRSRRGFVTPAALRRARCRPTPEHLPTAHRNTARTGHRSIRRRRAPPPPMQHIEDTMTRTGTRVVLFTAVCLVFMFILVTVFGQFRFDSRATYNAVFTNVSGLKGGNFVRIAGVEVGKVRDMTLHKDGTVTVEFAIDKSADADRGHQGGGALREPDRRPLPGAGRRTGLGAQTPTGTDDPARADVSCP